MSTVDTTQTPLLKVRDLDVAYAGRGRRAGRSAVKGASFDVMSTSTTALVGESGSGKSSIAKAILGLQAPSGGSIEFDGRSVVDPRGRYRREVLDDISMIFQDPFSSLNPSMTVGSTLAESLGRRRSSFSTTELDDRIRQVLGEVGMDHGAAARFPANFSGGQRQRIAIARALIREPRLIVCDEPTSALDLSVQAQILNLLLDVQEARQVAYLFISHDMAVVEHLADTVVVINEGEIVEQGGSARLFAEPQHPYTQRLLASAPRPVAGSR